MSDYKLLIDGKLVSGAMALNVVNPATEEVVAVAPRADRAQLEQAVAAAKAAFPRCCPSPSPVRDHKLLAYFDKRYPREGDRCNCCRKIAGGHRRNPGTSSRRSLY
jgi:acyl-CoA reductase-like NAD-dependent aldehyde dehydrogenase